MCDVVLKILMDMSEIFDVEAATIYTVRYRIKKKTGDKNAFNFLR